MSAFEESVATIFFLIRIMIQTLDDMIINNGVSWLNWLIGIMCALLISGVLIAPYLHTENIMMDNIERASSRRK